MSKWISRRQPKTNKAQVSRTGWSRCVELGEGLEKGRRQGRSREGRRGFKAAAEKRQLPGQGFAGGFCTDLLAHYLPVSPSVSVKEKQLFQCRADA